MKRTILGAALAAAVSLGAVGEAGAQSTIRDQIERSGIGSSRRDDRDRNRDDRYDRRDNRDNRDDDRYGDRYDRYDSRLNAVRLDEYLRGISLGRAQRGRVERAWNTRSSREQRLRSVRAQLSWTQQRRFDTNVAQIERRYGVYDRAARRG